MNLEQTVTAKVVIQAGNEFTYNGVSIRWFYNEGFKFKSATTVVYIDPISLPEITEFADFIIITHDHRPHYSSGDIAQITDANTVVITSTQTPGWNLQVEPGETLTYPGVTFEFVPAYNVNKHRPDGNLFHPPEHQSLGVIMDFGTLRIYHAGDTDRIPEMQSITTDIALLPVSGYAWMTASEAADSVEDLKIQSDLRYAIPMHYGWNGYNDFTGSYFDAQRFTELADCDVVILNNYDNWNPEPPLGLQNDSLIKTIIAVAGISLISAVVVLLIRRSYKKSTHS